MSDKPDAGTSTCQHITLTKDKNKIQAPAEFEFTIPKSQRPQTQAVDRVAIGIRVCLYTALDIFYLLKFSCD